MLIDIYMKFREDRLNGFQVIEQILYCVRVQGKLLESIHTRGMFFLRSARRLMLIDIYMKFREESLNGLRRYRADIILWQSPRKIIQKYKYKRYGSCALHVV